MPMLTTVLMRSPVAPRHSPLRSRSVKSPIRSSTSCTSATTSWPSTISSVPLGIRSATCSTARFFGGVDVHTGEHLVAVAFQVRGSGQIDEQRQRLARHPVLAVVDVQIADIHGQFGAPCRVVGEELAQVFGGDLVVMTL